MAKKMTDLGSAAAIKGDELLELVQAGVNLKVLAGALLPPSYIDGLKMVYGSGNALTIKSGAAYIPSLSRVLFSPADIALTGITLTASTWYHAYLYLNGTVPAVEVVTTAPAAAYNGTARTKVGDTSRRYIGSVRTDTSGVIYSFDVIGTVIKYRETTSNVPFRRMIGSTVTAKTTLSLAEVVPPTSKLAYIRVGAASDAPFRFTNSEANTPSAAPEGYMVTIPVGSTAFMDMPLNAVQEMIYFNANVPTAGACIVDVCGYTYER